MDPKIPAQGRGWQRKAGTRACCALAVTALLASPAPVSQRNETIQAVPQPLLCRVGSNPATAGSCSWLSGWQGCGRHSEMPGDAPFWVTHLSRSSRAAPPAQGLAPGYGSHTTELLLCQSLFE